MLGEAGGAREGDRLLAFGLSAAAQRPFPIGLDTDDFVALSRTPAALKACDRVSAHSLLPLPGGGVDRLDYSKGIPERLLGLREHYLKTHPDLVRARCSYLQIAPCFPAPRSRPTRRSGPDVLALAGRT